MSAVGDLDCLFRCQIAALLFMSLYKQHVFYGLHCCCFRVFYFTLFRFAVLVNQFHIHFILAQFVGVLCGGYQVAPVLRFDICQFLLHMSIEVSLRCVSSIMISARQCSLVSFIFPCFGLPLICREAPINFDYNLDYMSAKMIASANDKLGTDNRIFAESQQIAKIANGKRVWWS